MRNPVTGVLWTLSLLCTAFSHQSMPYNPTTILLPQSSSPNKDIAYIFLLPGSDSNAQHELVSLNISSTLSTSNISFETITSSLPFQNDHLSAFIPSISAAGDISVYAGSCSTSTGSELWRYTPSNTPSNTSTVEDGTWIQQTTNTGGDVTSASLVEAEFLSRGFSFSTFANANASETNIYVFGGMCPESEATASAWQSSASYSNRMLRLRPSVDNEYTLGLPTSRGPPIAEAGFTITGLTPTYSNGSGVMTQQQNFVLLGGHTKTAFINMSQVAIWSLPEESWSFVTISSPSSSNANTELAVKSTVTSVDSRSGHSTVLTEDGSRMIVYGGWVGVIGQAADPQLAVLSVGSGFGGDGDWQWIVPDEQPGGAGVYGHGAVMLPGNVMMILGGNNISSSGNTKRQSGPAAQAMFLNATSMTWISNYTNPEYVVATADKKASESSSSSNSKKIGLGAGLGLGLAAIIGALVMFCWYSRRLRRRGENREKDIRDLSAVGANYHSSSGEMGQRNGGFPWANGRWNNNNNDHGGPVFDSNSAVAGYENLQAGVHGLGDNGGYPPPPKQIPRKPLHSRNARGMYQPTPSFDFNAGTSHGRANSLGTAGPIHPIYEADEEELSRKSNEGVGVALGDPGTSESNRYSDPFRDPANYSTPLRRDNRRATTPDNESPAYSREREIQEWVSDWAAADALLNSQARSHSTAGRLSPTRRAQLIAASTISSVSAEEDSGRTASNLSDRSVAISTMSISRSGSSSQGRSRSNSLRGFIANAMNPFSAAVLTSTAPSTTLSPVFDGHRLPQAPRSAGSTSSSFTTANTSFAALQAEGGGLLPRPDEVASGEYSPTRSQPDGPGSPSKSKSAGLGKGRAQAGWLGSLRKVFVGESGSGNISPDFQAIPSRDISPVRSDHGIGRAAEPRRTVSAGAKLWRRKQGKNDWEDSAQIPGLNARSNTFTGDLSSTIGLGGQSMTAEEEEEWDIERAVQNRVVQVMFTVPKEKLRVVNHNVDDDLSEVGSLRSKKGSNKSIKLLGDSLERVVEAPILPEGKGKEKEFETAGETLNSNRKSKVLEMVEMMEGRNSPEH